MRALKGLTAWAEAEFGIDARRDAARRPPRPAGLAGERVKKRPGQGDPAKRAAHVERLPAPFEDIRDRETCVGPAGESHPHRDTDRGYGWGTGRLWRVNRSVACDLAHGECLPSDGGVCNGGNTAVPLGRVARWGEGKGRAVAVWGDAPRHTAKAAEAGAKGPGVERVSLPGYSPDPNPIERLWDWLRDGLTRGHCRDTRDGLKAACREALGAVNAAPDGVIRRLWREFDLDEEVEAKLRLPA